MPDSANILISVDERYVQSMLAGTKTIELRRRAVRVPKGTTVWIYSKVPVGQLRACGIVKDTVEASPKEIWRDYGHLSGITADEFDDYYAGTEKACALLFSQVNEIPPNLTLNALRSKLQTFHPPQFFKYLRQDSEELELFRQHLYASA